MKKILMALLFLLVAGCGGGGNSSVDDKAPSVTVGAPEGLSGESDGTVVTLSWLPVDNASGYNLYYASDDALDIGNYAAYENGTLQQSVTAPLTVDVNDPAPVYHFVVTAMVDGVESMPSAMLTLTPRYKVTGDNGQYVTDLVSGLEWSRCTYGQTWNADSSSCDGTAIRMNYATAISVATDAGMSIPTWEQLDSLVYCSNGDAAYFPFELGVSDYSGYCYGDFQSPTIVETFFPNTPTAAVNYLTTSTCYSDVMMKPILFLDGSTKGCPERDNPNLAVYLRMFR